MNSLRYFSTTAVRLAKSNKFKPDPAYKLKCGLEIHTQLDTKHKLFSLSQTSTLHLSANSHVSFFDVGLPGTQPRLNAELVLQLLKLLVVLGCQINENSTFDRKHYFYGDQPLGYQITQHYNPVAKGGTLVLSKKLDDIDENEKHIRFEQLQIEQDTGRSIYKKQGVTEIDFNRANMALVEIVTKPDFENLKQIKLFVRKFQLLLKKLGVSTLDLETGAMRVDVNLSVNDGPRIEMKNLSNTTLILSAIRYEYLRQVNILKQESSFSHDQITKETRGWDADLGQTFSLRSKEDTADYRYMPDPELAPLALDSESLVPQISHNLIPELPDAILHRLMALPYNCKIRDAMILLQDDQLMQYYLALVEALQSKKIDAKLLVNWCCHELQGAMTKLGHHQSHGIPIPAAKLAELIALIHVDKQISNNNAKMLLLHLLANKHDLHRSLDDLIDEFELRLQSTVNDAEVDAIVEQVMAEHAELVAQIRLGEKPNSIHFLLGQCMRASRGKIDNKVLLARLKSSI